MLKTISDRILRIQLKRDEREIKIGFLITGLIILLLFANVFYLNFFILQSNSAKPSYSMAPAQVAVSPTQIPVQTLISTPTPTLRPLQNTITQKKITYKNYYINLGTGTNQSTDWADVAGTINTFDIAAYNNIREVHLETQTNVPTANGTISVRLFNKTDGYAVWNSDRTVQAEASGSLLISQNIIYDVGPRMYQVQMKSQLNVPANLVQARLHIVAQ